MRLHREPMPGQGGWVSERELWRRRGRASWHMVDGALPAPVPAGWQGISEAWELVEVELHQKARPRLLAALKTRAPHTARITYYVPTALRAAVGVEERGTRRFEDQVVDALTGQRALLILDNCEHLVVDADELETRAGAPFPAIPEVNSCGHGPCCSS